MRSEELVVERGAPDRKASELTSGVNSGQGGEFVFRIEWFTVYCSWFIGIEVVEVLMWYGRDVVCYLGPRYSLCE